MRSVLVTGGTRGLGLAIATTLATAGYRVAAVARSISPDFEAAAEAIRESGRGALDFHPFDLNDIDGIAGMARAARGRHGPFHGLVNNAGIGTHGLLATMRNSDIEALVRLNTLAPIVLTKYIVRQMMADGGGRVVNIASIVGSTGYRGLAAYAATKASMIGFTRSLAREVGSLGVCVNAVAPGFIATDMTHGLGDAEMRQVVRRSALQRLAGADDVARTVEFLLGDGGAAITGTVVTVDAGNTA